MKILSLTRYCRRGASSRLRFFQYYPYLDRDDFTIDVLPLLDEVYLENLYNKNKKPLCGIIKAYIKRLVILLHSKKYDLIFIEKEIYPWLPAWAEFFLSLLKIPYVVDYDDAIFHNYDLHTSKLVRILLSKKIAYVMKNSALVIAGNRYIYDYATRSGAHRVALVPTVIDLNRYFVNRKHSNQTFTIGWIGSPSTAKFLRIVESPLLQFCKEVNAKIVLIGAGKFELEVPFEIKEWSEMTEVSEIQSFDVGIMPLHDEPWEKGKCGYKLIQYMACGIPVVSSPVGINKEIVDHGKNGFLANDNGEWLKSFRELYYNPEMRIKFGNSGRTKVETTYSVQKTAPLISRLLKEAKNY